MNKWIIGLAVALAAGSAGAATTVTFVEPDKFADVPFSHIERERVLDDLRKHVEKLGARLPAGQDLRVEVLDVDLAGITRPTSTRPDMRILNGGADWPRLHLRYTIEQDGQVLKSGEAKLSNPNYLMGFNRYTQEMYSHEKQMLEDWWRKEVVAVR